MYTMIVVMYVQYAGTSIPVTQTTLLERYKDAQACELAGRTMKKTSVPNVPEVNDLRVGFLCVESGSIKPLN